MSFAKITKTAIKIPARIPRGPTDILKALSATVKYLPTEPVPLLLDDPFLLPTRPFHKRLFLLSRMSGVKTAQFLLSKHPEMFRRDDAEPKVEAFIPKEEFTPDMEFTIEDLVWCIDNKDPQNGIIAYKSLVEKGEEISRETLLDFYEMICYTNEENLYDQTEQERLKFLPFSERNLEHFTWKNTGLATKIFDQMKSDVDPSRVYSAMIAGLVRFNEHRKAIQTFEEFTSNHPDQSLYPVAYDSLLRSITKIHASKESAMEAVDNIVKDMERNEVKPDLKIFNSILYIYKSFDCDDHSCQEAFKLVNDMYDLGIEPSLATFSSLMSILVRFKRGTAYGAAIKDILTNLQSHKITLRDSRDVEFIKNAMHVAAVRLNNVALANSVYKIYLNNPTLFRAHVEKNRFLNDYFKLLVTADTLENSLKFYIDNAPHNFAPDLDAFDAFTQLLELYGRTTDELPYIPLKEEDRVPYEDRRNNRTERTV